MIGADVVITGNVSAKTDLHLDGAVEGDVRCASLVQGESGRILGSIVAETARISGRVEGSINVRELVIERSAHVAGDVSYETISIASGGHVEGRFVLRGSAPAEGESPLKLIAGKAEPERQASR